MHPTNAPASASPQPSLGGIPKPDHGRYGAPKVANLRLLREAVNRLRPEQFDMDQWAACGTKFCAGGWLFVANPHLGVVYDGARGFVTAADGRRVRDMYAVLADALGISYEDSERLFSPSEVAGCHPEKPADWLARLDAWLAVHAPAALGDRPARVPSEAEAAAERSAHPDLECEV